MADAGQTLGVSFDVKPPQTSGQQILHLSALAPTTPRTVSGLVFLDRSGTWRVGPLEANLTAVTKRVFLILGALLVLGDVGSIAFEGSETFAVTATGILIACVSALALTAEYQPNPKNARKNCTDLATSTAGAVTATASSAIQ